MKVLEPISVDAMIAAWLLAELDSRRPIPRACVRDGLAGAPESVIRAPDLTSATENELRAAILTNCRGWMTGAFMFPGFPFTATQWHRAELEPLDVLAVRGSSGWDPWEPLAEPTGTYRTAVARIAARTEPPGAADLIQAGRLVAARYACGENLGEPILAGHPSGPPWVALEGHTRLLGWALAARDEPLGVIVGLSDRIGDWQRFDWRRR